MYRGLALSLVIVAAVVAYCSAKPPNIVMIVADDLGWGDLGYENGSIMKTPHIDHLAKNGVILNNYYVQPMCTPTRGTIMTGMYPIHTGLQHSVILPETPYGLPLQFTLLPQRLKEAGYATHMVGKWHLGMVEWGYTPTHRGFDSYFGNYLEAADHFNYLNRGILDLHENKAKGKLDFSKETYSSHLYAERASKVINDHDPSQPLFLYLPFLVAHNPVQAPTSYSDLYKDVISDDIRRTYAGMVSSMDEAVKNVTNTLTAKGMMNDTLIVFTSDNGGIPQFGGYNYPLRGYKIEIWEGGVRAKAFVHGSMIEKPGRVSNDLLHATDWFPTLINRAGLKVTEDIDGFNVWDTISKGAPSPREEILINIDDAYIPRVKGQPFLPWLGSALRYKDWKLVQNAPNSTWHVPPEKGGRLKPGTGGLNYYTELIKEALFNIATDPRETTDVKHLYPEVLADLRARLEAYKNTRVRPLNQLIDPNAARVAKAAGYWKPWLPEGTTCGCRVYRYSDLKNGTASSLPNGGNGPRTWMDMMSSMFIIMIITITSILEDF